MEAKLFLCAITVALSLTVTLLYDKGKSINSTPVLKLVALAVWSLTRGLILLRLALMLCLGLEASCLFVILRIEGDP